MGIIIKNSEVKKDFIFNMDNINTFIKFSIDLITAKLDEILLEKGGILGELK